MGSILPSILTIQMSSCRREARAGPFCGTRIRSGECRIEDLGVPKRSAIPISALDVAMRQTTVLWPSNCAKEGVDCPFCRIALKAASYRGIAVSYCPLCGGTWVDHMAFENLLSPVHSHHRLPGWLLRVVLLTALILIGCLIGAVAVGAVRVWPALQSWTESFFAGKERELNSQLRWLADRTGNPRLTELSRAGLDPALLSKLIADSGDRKSTRLNSSHRL